MTKLAGTGIDEYFSEFDANNNEQLEVEEILLMLTELELPHEKEDILAIFDAADKDKNLKIDRKEFREFLLGFAKDDSPEDDASAAWPSVQVPAESTDSMAAWCSQLERQIL